MAALAFASSAAAEPHHVRTIATTRVPVFDLLTDGSRLAWASRGLEVFDQATGKRASLGSPPCGDDYWGWVDTAFAGTRALFECGGASLGGVGAKVFTAALVSARVRPLGEFDYSKSLLDGFDRSFTYGFGARVAGGDGALVYFGSGSPNDDSYTPLRQGVWRVVSGGSVRIPYQPELLGAIAVSRGRIATLDWERSCGCDWFPVYSPDGRTIAWNHDGAVWTMSASGAGARRRSTLDAADARTAPRWSPTGSTLAFEGNGYVQLIGRDGTNERQLVAGTRPAWSPDGTTIAFVRNGAVWLVGADGTGVRQLTYESTDVTSRPEWSPDGKKLAVSSAGGIWIVDAQSGTEQEIASGPGFDDHDPVWSPDGSQIAFERRTLLAFDQYPSTLFIVDADGRNLRQLPAPKDSSGESAPAWSPDGRRIAFANDSIDGQYKEIWIVAADGSGARMLGGGRSGAPVWSPDGSSVTYGDDDVGETSRESGGIVRTAVASKLASVRVYPRWTTPLEVRNLVTGKLIRRWDVPAQSTQQAVLAFSGRYIAARIVNGHDVVLDRYDLTSAKPLAPLGLKFHQSLSGVSLSARWGVYRADRRVVLFDMRSDRRTTLATVQLDAVGPVIVGKRVFWAEPYRNGSRVRKLDLTPNGTVKAAP